MAKKTYKKYKKNYYKKYPYYKQVVASRNYFKVKAEAYDYIEFEAQNGIITFRSQQGEQVALNRGVLTIGNVMDGYAYSVTLAGLFSYYKIIGIAIELMPEASNTNGAKQITDERAIYLGFRSGSNNVATINEVRAFNQSLLLDSVNRQRRYWKTFGMYGDWTVSNQPVLGAFIVKNQGDNSSNNVQPSWKIKISLYLLYKLSKA